MTIEKAGKPLKDNEISIIFIIVTMVNVQQLTCEEIGQVFFQTLGA